MEGVEQIPGQISSFVRGPYLLIPLLLLAGVIVKETRSYFDRVGRTRDVAEARGETMGSAP